jgi:GNAT superfamily N-acetyltransferase
MAYSIRLPDGTSVDNIPDEVTPEAAKARILQLRPELFGAQKPAKDAGFSLGDIAKSFGMGAAGSTKALTDVAGAENVVSSKLGDVSKSLQESMTPERQAELQRQQERMKAAEKEGTWAEIKAAAQNIAEAPLQSVAQGVGSFVPYLPALFAAPAAAALRLAPGAVRAITAVADVAPKVIGTAQGAGAVKGSIYDGVYQAEKDAGATDDVARQKATAAQDYFGKNFDQIALGTGLGYLAGSTGIEKLLTPSGKAAAQQGVARRVAGAVASEAPMEGAQGGQERLAQNIALQREGRDVGTFTGVAGQAVQEGLMGALSAGPVAALRGPGAPAPQPKEEEKPLLALGAEKVFTPTPLPDGSVAMTREDLARYEEEQFQKKYAAQAADKPYAPAPSLTGTDMASLLSRRAGESGIESLLADRRVEQENARIEEARRARVAPESVEAGRDVLSADRSNADLMAIMADRRAAQAEAEQKEAQRLARAESQQAKKQAALLGEVESPMMAGIRERRAAQEAADAAAKLKQEQEQKAEAEKRAVTPVSTKTPMPGLLGGAPAGGDLANIISERRAAEEAKAEIPLNDDYAFLQREKQRLLSEEKTPQSKLMLERIDERMGEILKRDIENMRKDKEKAATSVFAEENLPPVEERDVVVGNKELAELQAPTLPSDEKVTGKEARQLRQFEKQRTEPAPVEDAQARLEQAEMERRKFLRSKDEQGGNLLKLLEGKLSPDEVSDIAPKGKGFEKLAGKNGTYISELISDGLLDEFLPPDERVGMTNFDAEKSSETIKEKLRNKDNMSFDRSVALRQLDDQIADLEQQAKQPSAAEFDVSDVEPGEAASIDRSAADDVRFKRSANTKNIGKEAVQSIIDAIKARWKNAPEVVVAADMNDPVIPQEVRDHNQKQVKGGAKGSPQGFFYKGKAYIIADQIDSVKDAMEALMHEALGHYGLRGVFGKKMEEVLRDVIKYRRTEVEGKAEQYGLDPKNDEDLLEAAEEVLAVMAQTKPGLPFVKRAMAIIRNFLRDLGFNIKMSDADIIQKYILPARAFVESGKGRAAEGKAAASREAVSSIPAGLTSIGYKLIPRGDERRFKGFGTWEKDGVRVALSGDLLAAERGTVQKYESDGDAMTVEAVISDAAARGQGRARKAMQDVIRFADEVGKDLYLEPVQLEKESGLNREQLVQFYSSLGFKPTDSSGLVMERKSKPAASRKSGKSGSVMFDPKEIENNLTPEYKSRTKLIEMSIDDFLGLSDEGTTKYKAEGVDELVKGGKKFSSLPFLMIDNDGNVEGHEGRHRARALKQAGYTTMPVILRSSNIRWSEQYSPDRFDYVENWPSKMKAEKNAANPNFSIDFPVSREDSGKAYDAGVVGKPAAMRKEGAKTGPTTEAFKRWFGNSKVVDADGNPLVVYTGTSKDFDFSKFKIPKNGAWFTGSPEEASAYAKENDSMGFEWEGGRLVEVNAASRVMPVYLKIENPYTLTEEERDTLFKADNYKRAQGVIFERAKARGFDGVDFGNGIWVVIKEPNQIKSAIGNIGTYDSKKADIRYKRSEKPTPSQAGKEALAVLESTGMQLPPAEPGRVERVKAAAKSAAENPAMTIASAKQAISKFLDKMEVAAFSGDAAFNNDVRRNLIADFDENSEVLGMLLEASQSQAVHSDALASQFIIDGGIAYDEEAKKWVSIKKEDNFIALAQKIDKLAEKYGLTKEQAERVAHTYFVAKRFKSLLSKQRSRDSEIDRLEGELEAENANIKKYRKENDYEKVRTSERAKNDIKAEIKKLKEAEVFITPDQIALIEPGMSLAKSMPELTDISDTWQGIRANAVKAMIDGGLWSREQAENMLDNIDYVPFYREEQLEEGGGPQEFVKGLQIKAKEYRLKGSGSPVNDVFDNMVRWSQYAINRSVRNHKALQMVDIGTELQVGDRKMAEKTDKMDPKKNTIRVFRDGTQEIYSMADPLYVDAFSAISNVTIPSLKFFTWFSNLLRQSVVLYPLFSVAQVPQDAISAMFSSGLKTKYALRIPVLAVKEFIKTLNKTSATHNLLKTYGATGVRDFSAAIARKDVEIAAGLKAQKSLGGRVLEGLSHIAMAADNSVRQAVYDASMAQGLSKAEAIEKAFDIINFRRRGTSKMINLAGQTVPFFYAYMSVQRTAYKTLTGVGISPQKRSEALKTLATTSGAMMAMALFYTMMNADDEEYKKTPEAIRDRTLNIPGTGGLRIPLRPDLFLMPKVMTEHLYHLITDNGLSDSAKFRKSVSDGIANAVLSPQPIPQALKPAIEVGINYDFFQGRPLIGQFEKQKEAERQFNDNTSEFSKVLGQFGVSPIAADHVIRGMFGSAGGLFLYATNFMINSDPDVPRPELSFRDAMAALPGTSGFVTKASENALKGDFYALRDEVEKTKNTYNDIKTRSPQELEQFLSDEKNIARLGLAKGTEKIGMQLSKIRRAIAQITNAPEDLYSASEKKDAIKELRQVEKEILQSINLPELRKQAMI